MPSPKRERVYVDMDGVLCNFRKRYLQRIKSNPKNLYPQLEFDFFRKLEPIPGGIDAMKALEMHYDTWILTRPSFKNPMCYTEKRLWVEDYLGEKWCKRLIISPDKGLLKGDYLIDDKPWPDFEGEQLQFGSKDYPTWDEVMQRLLPQTILPFYAFKRLP